MLWPTPIHEEDDEEEKEEEEEQEDLRLQSTSNAATPADSWCVTDRNFEKKKYSFHWTVNNFSMCSDCTDLSSSTFSGTGSEGDHQWCLKLDLSEGFKEREYHRETQQESGKRVHRVTYSDTVYSYPTMPLSRSSRGGYPSTSSTVPGSDDSVSLILKLVKPSSSSPRVRASCVFAILDSTCQKVHRKEDKKVRHFKAGTEWGIGDFIQRKHLLKEANKFLPQDKLTVHCEVTEIVGDGAPVHVTGKYSVRVSECSLAGDFRSLLEEGLLSDVTLVNVKSKKEFEAHKAILSIRSPVFKRMFQHEMKEKATNRVEIEDTEDQVLHEMLTFIYTGKAPNIVSMTGTQVLIEGLFSIAEKYEVCRLKEMCAEAMCKNLSSSNAVNTLLLADKYSSHQLREACIEFIVGHASQVMATQEWKDLQGCPNYFKMVTEIYEIILKQKVPGFEDSLDDSVPSKKPRLMP